MEDRVALFQSVAESKLQGDKLLKELLTLRRFLFKNQNHRFTEREKQKLYTAIQTHYANNAKTDSAPFVLNLIEDALKMPFTVFSTSQKAQLLKWHDALLGDAAPAAAAGTIAVEKRYVCMDISEDGFLSLMLDGDSAVIENIRVSEVSERRAIRQALDDGCDVLVTVRGDQLVDFEIEKPDT